MYEDFAEIGRNLLSLEVNTMISESGITAEKMPVAARALIQVAQDYQAFLARCLDELAASGRSPAALPAIQQGDGTVEQFVDWDVRTGGTRTFKLLRHVARTCQDMAELFPRDNASVLARIVASCDQIYAIFLAVNMVDMPIDQSTVQMAEEEHAAIPALSNDALVVLRKIWDLGTSTVVMQTVVQIDGDVIVRVLDGWQRGDNTVLHALHHQAVDAALQRWSFLVQTAGELLGFFLGLVRSPDSARRPAALG